MKVAAAAVRLGLAVSTVRLMVKRGELETDSETDSSGAGFVTRASIEQCQTCAGDPAAGQGVPAETVPLADVVRFTGRGRN